MLFQMGTLRPVFVNIVNRLDEELRSQTSFDFFDTYEIDSDDEMFESARKKLISADFVLMAIHGGLPYFKRYLDLEQDFVGKKPLFFLSGIEDEEREMRARSLLSPTLLETLGTYCAAGGEKNLSAFLYTVLRDLAHLHIHRPIPEPIFPKWDRIYDRYRGSGFYPLSVSKKECAEEIAKKECTEKECAKKECGEKERAEKERAEKEPIEGECAEKKSGFKESGEGNSEETAIAEAEYMERIQKTDKPIVGILVHYHYYERNDTAAIDALISEVEKAGGTPYAVVTNVMPQRTYLGFKDTIEKYLLPVGISSLIVTFGNSMTALASPGSGSMIQESVFRRLNVPVIQAMTTYYDMERWKASPAGLDSMLLSTNVYQTEFDGQIISVPFAVTEAMQTAEGVIRRSVPIPDRCVKVARMAVGWARLRNTPSEQKKVAFVFHNTPPRVDQIGCAFGLNSVQSVYRMIQRLKEEGVRLAYEWESPEALIDRIRFAVTNEDRFLTAEEMAERAEIKLPKSIWGKLFQNLPEKIVAELRGDYGEAPGSLLVSGEDILIPGIQNGHIFVGLQPPRTSFEKLEEAYHSADIVCPYQYFAFYHYLNEIFHADVIVHVGTHGTLEWLPGKEIGLSEECYPDAVFGSAVHLYPYIINVPGEGAQAKRRSGAVILDHMIPSMTSGGLYDDLAALETLLERYYHAKINTPSKCSELFEQIRSLSESFPDTSSDSEIAKNADAFVQRLHLYLTDIKTTKIKSGLHIFGSAPSGRRYLDMLALLLTVRNGDVPSLREAILRLSGLFLSDLSNVPGRVLKSGITVAMLLDRIDEAAELFLKLILKQREDGREHGYSQVRDEVSEFLCAAICESDLEEMRKEHRYKNDTAETRIESYGGMKESNEKHRYADDEDLKKLFDFIVRELMPKLDRTDEEMYNFLCGIRGEFVPEGGSGAPSRGNVQILPTGRNFYMIDPCSVPTRIAYSTGVRLAEDLLRNYDSKKIPEQIAMVVYSGETISTTGDDIGEILYLYGVRPVWIENTDRVIGLEMIPLSELGRPRIDVTLRISGLFRDTFPNLIDLIEDAVSMVATLDEPHDMNYVKKHVDQDMEKYLSEGLSDEMAKRYSTVRVFGCPLGNYGAGVDLVMESGKWENSDDLANAYVRWSAHAYGRQIYGKHLGDVFSTQLSRTEATIKNNPTLETDMLDDTCYFVYHGGLISAVKQARGGVAPHSYVGHSDRPDAVKTLTVQEDTARIMRARILNPKWREGLMEHGFDGARVMSEMMDIVFGWDATAEIAEQWMYEGISECFVRDEKVSDWMRDVNPHALHHIAERLLESAARGMWNPDRELIEILRKRYLDLDAALEG